MKESEIKQHINTVLKGNNLRLFVYLSYKEKQSEVGSKADRHVYKLAISDEDMTKLIEDESFQKELRRIGELEDDCFQEIDYLFEESSKNVYVAEANNPPFNELTSLFEEDVAQENFKADRGVDGVIINYQSDEGCFWTLRSVGGRTFVKNKFLIFGTSIQKQSALLLDGLVDVLKIDDIIVVVRPKGALNYFDFEPYVEKQNNETISTIKTMKILSNKSVEKLQKYIASAKKHGQEFLQISKSPVLKIPTDTLLSRIKDHEQYSQLIDKKDGTISIKKQKDISLLISLLKDGYLNSLITDMTYNVSVKKEIE